MLKENKKNNLLITGGTGTIGSRLYNYLERKKKYNLFIGSRSKEIKGNKNKIRRINYESKLSIDRALKDINIIIHTIGLDSKACIRNPKLANKVHIKYTQNLINSAIESGVTKIIYLSTWKVYSDEFNDSFTEKHKLKANHPYSLSKSKGEQALLSKNYKNKIDTIIVRLPNGFGAPSNHKANNFTLVREFCYSAINNGYIKISGNPYAIRPFSPIDEICKLIEFFIKNSFKKKQLIVNAANCKSYSLLDMAEIIKKRVQKKLNKECVIKINNKNIYKNNRNIDYFIYKSRSLSQIGYRNINVSKAKINKEIDALIDFVEKQKVYV